MSHITSEQRYTIDVLLSRDASQLLIAETIGKCKSVISREIIHNCDKRGGQYSAVLAQRKYEQRKEYMPKRKRFTTSVQACVDLKTLISYSYQNKRRNAQTVNRINKNENLIHQFVHFRITLGS